MADLLYEVKDKIATITLNRPDKLNAFTGDMIDGVGALARRGPGRRQRQRRHRHRRRPRVLLGRRRRAHARRASRRRSTARTALWEGVHRVPKQLEQMDKPVIAMVNGLAVGAGMGMCVMCDMRVAAESARFSTGYVRVGLVPGDGDTYFLPRLVGAAKALELLWTADFIEAPEAHRLGIVQRVVPDAQLKDATYALARQIADGPQIPVRMIKRLVYQSLQARSAHAPRPRQLAHVDRAPDGRPRRRRGRVQGEAPGEVLGTLVRASLVPRAVQ